MHQYLSPNTRGRDFLVGDLHGTYSALMRGLEKVKFDPARDRLLSTGDLADRGPEPMECLRLLAQPWFYACLGNHEELLVGWLIDGLYNRNAVRSAMTNGAQWLYALSVQDEQELHEQLLPMVCNMPRIISVGDALLPFKVAHAELMTEGVPLRDENLHDARVLQDAGLLWGRTLASLRRLRKVKLFALDSLQVTREPWAPALGLTYVGHEVVDRPILHQSHLYIDFNACGHARDESFAVRLVEHRAVVAELRKHGYVG